MNIDIGQSMRAFAAAMASQERVNATPKGMKANALREEGLRAHKAGDPETALHFYEMAAACFAPDDTSDGAAAAWHDLAEALLWSGEYWTSRLPRAEALLRQALACEGRRQDPRRYALTLSSLSVCLRRLAERAPRGDEQEQLLRESIASAERALTIATPEQGPVVLSARAGALVALGNALRLARRFGAAIKQFREAREAFESCSRFGMGGDAEVGAATLGLVRSLIERGKRQDLAEARKIFRSGARCDAHTAPSLQMAAAKLELGSGRGDKQHLTAARWHLSMAVKDEIPPLELGELATLAIEAGWVGPALEHMYRWLDRATMQRQSVGRDRDADHIADQMQDVAWHVATLELARGDATAAFLALENVSALRWIDTLMLRACQQAPGTDSALLGRFKEASLDLHFHELAIDMLKLAPFDEVFKEVQDRIGQLVEEEPALGDAIKGFWSGLTAGPEAFGRVRQRVDDKRKEAQALHRELERNPAWQAISRFGEPMTPMRLEALVKQHHESVFVRLAIRERVRAIAAWWDGTKLMTAVLETEGPAGLVRLLGQIETRGHGTHHDRAEAGALLDTLDLSSVFGPAGRHRLVVLANNVASRLPIDVVGPRGKQAIDRFDAVVSLPSLVGLELPALACGGREGTVVLAPDGTHFSPLAFGDVDGLEVVSGKSATLAAYRDAASRARVLAMYTHGRHRDTESDESVLVLADGVVHPPGDGCTIEGLERVELWACESGIDRSNDDFGPTADELYGIDGAYLLAGARSTIGTLWPVRDLVTACIARRFRQGLARGMRADAALLAAKRWWRDVGVDLLSRAMVEGGANSVVAAVAASLDQAAADVVGAELAPAAASDVARSLDWLVTDLADPFIWAGYRFMGDWRSGDE